MSTATDAAWAAAKAKYQLHHVIASARTASQTGTCAAKLTYGGMSWGFWADEEVAVINILDDGTWSEVRPRTAIRQATSEVVSGIPCSGGTLGVLCSDNITCAVELSESAALIAAKEENAKLTDAVIGSKTSENVSDAIKALALAAVVVGAVIAVSKLAPIVRRALK